MSFFFVSVVSSWFLSIFVLFCVFRGYPPLVAAKGRGVASVLNRLFFASLLSFSWQFCIRWLKCLISTRITA